MRIDGFDWDEGNWPKCRQHGLSKDAIEEALQSSITVFNDQTFAALVLYKMSTELVLHIVCLKMILNIF